MSSDEIKYQKNGWIVFESCEATDIMDKLWAFAAEKYAEKRPRQMKEAKRQAEKRLKPKITARQLCRRYMVKILEWNQAGMRHSEMAQRVGVSAADITEALEKWKK